MKLAPHVKLIIDRLNEHEYEAFLVGGCVRDWLLGKNPKDFDIATNALPKTVSTIFHDYHVLETGILHGTVSIIIDNHIVEVTTYRIDGKYLDNRRPMNVEFTSSIKRDLARRDFTINAIAYSPRAGLIDPYGGKKDLESKILRCVGNPKRRFEEDALRILRALRFVSELGFNIDENSSNAMHELSGNINLIAPERIQTEFSKCLLGDYLELVLTIYREIIAQIVPEIRGSFNFSQNNPYHIYDVYEHTIKVTINTPAVLHLRICGLLHDIGKPESYSVDKKGVGHFYGHTKASAKIAREFCEKWRFDNLTSKKVYELVLLHDMALKADKIFIKHFLRKHSKEILDDLILLKRADIKGQNPDKINRLNELEIISNKANEVIKNNECYLLKDLDLSGDDLIGMGFSPGRQIGKILNDCLTQVIDEKVDNSCEQLADYVRIKYL